MYKIQICMRYLRSRVIAYFAILGVMLCVAVMLIVVSVMTGFLDKIELAAKGLFGDLVMEANEPGGIAEYDEFIKLIKAKVPEIQDASPFILSYGILRLPGEQYRQPVMIAGIRLPERVDVSEFEKGLFIQAGQARPTFDPGVDAIIEALKRDAEKIKAIGDRLAEADDAEPLSSDDRHTLRLANHAMMIYGNVIRNLERDPLHQKTLERLRKQLADAVAAGAERADIKPIRDDIRYVEERSVNPPANRIIVGRSMPGFSQRTKDGETIRFRLPGENVYLYVFPLGRELSLTDLQPNKAMFTIIDDCRTDVSSIDSKFVYVPFQTLQQLNDMGAEFSAVDPNVVVELPRCNQIHIKVRSQYAATEQSLQLVRGKIRDLWQEFRSEFAARNSLAVSAGSDATIKTWRERQQSLLSSIAAQRVLSLIVVGVVSIVAIVLIFVLFYMIVLQKTKDIGILKAIGASGWGVATIFLGYGAAIGLVGAILGSALGWWFVHNINVIHDAVGRWFGLQIWSKEMYLFEQIPEQVDPAHAMVIIAGAMAAGLMGAIIPAIRAARMQPVEALRYE